ncbi:hypothetical protein D9M70_611610 [compost metagenome]
MSIKRRRLDDLHAGTSNRLSHREELLLAHSLPTRGEEPIPGSRHHQEAIASGVGLQIERTVPSALLGQTDDLGTKETPLLDVGGLDHHICKLIDAHELLPE